MTTNESDYTYELILILQVAAINSEKLCADFSLRKAFVVHAKQRVLAKNVA